MRRRLVLLLLPFFAAMLVACGGSSSGSGGYGAPANTAAGRYGTAAAKVSSSVDAGATATVPAGNASAGNASAGNASAGGATIAAADSSLGKILVDADGRTLYLYTKDSQGKPSTCSGGCASAWPPVVVSAAPVAGSGIDAGKLTTVARPDGAKQAAYNGWPLYRYADDAKAGDVTGEGVGGVWYAIDGAGNAVKK
jgi:predicted lipoprotein with Yx(FWY)xxD motif